MGHDFPVALSPSPEQQGSETLGHTLEEAWVPKASLATNLSTKEHPY